MRAHAHDERAQVIRKTLRWRIYRSSRLERSIYRTSSVSRGVEGRGEGRPWRPCVLACPSRARGENKSFSKDKCVATRRRKRRTSSPCLLSPSQPPAVRPALYIVDRYRTRSIAAIFLSLFLTYILMLSFSYLMLEYRFLQFLLHGDDLLVQAL